MQVPGSHVSYSVGIRGGGSWWSPLVTNRSSVAPADRKGDDRGDPALIKRICGFESRLVLGPVIPKTLHGTHDEVGTVKQLVGHKQTNNNVSPGRIMSKFISSNQELNYMMFSYIDFLQKYV